MSLNNEHRHQFDKLVQYRDQISECLFHIELILKEYFPEEFDLAYQHYIPQIKTALFDEKKWLSRGGYNMQDTINNIFDKLKDDSRSGVSKYIK